MPISLLNVPAAPAVSPHNCVLLVAIPLDKDSFFKGPSGEGQPDFARTYCDNFCGDKELAWRVYQKYAGLAIYVIDQVRAAGVSVTTNASLENLHQMLPRFSITTLVAQWRDARFRPGDIADYAVAARWVRELTGVKVAAEPVALTAALNTLLKVPDQPHRPLSRAEITSQQYEWHDRRLKIEGSYPGAVRGGAGVEFGSRFYSIEEIMAGIPRYFAGTLDLTVCQSVLLSEELRRRCKDCSILASAGLTDFDFRFAVYHQVIEVIRRQPQPWEDAVLSVRKELLKR